MGLFGDDSDGGYDYDNEYVSRIAENGEDETVTAEVLTATDSNRVFSGSGYVRDQPLIAHLEADEQPHYVFHNDETGVITTSDGSELKPGANYRTIATFTDCRLFLLVGHEDGDGWQSIPYEKFTGFNAKNDATRFIVETDDEGYIFEVEEPLDESHVLNLIEFLIFRTGIEAWEFPDDWREGIQRRRAQRLSGRAEGSFDIDELEAILAPLEDDEQPQYLVPASSVTVGHLENAYNPIDTVVMTDQRILLNGEDATYDLTDFESDEKIALETSIPYHSLDWVEGRSKDGESGTLVARQTWGPVCLVHVPEEGANEVVDAIRYVQRQILTSRIDYDDVDPLERIEQLRRLNRAGYVADDLFEAKKQSLLDRF